ncbi:hypothetical protein NDU88_007047 [Pleurodeles waltl]|uniref:Uncharacterized protein n=1 Tax=Pleurodeles waltl TaxID=8319 RepID=A0AAV7PN61_PLEWA|nr:hypothetical protein NDU88_007047 [Pleurodeles waltl]
MGCTDFLSVKRALPHTDAKYSFPYLARLLVTYAGKTLTFTNPKNAAKFAKTIPLKPDNTSVVDVERDEHRLAMQWGTHVVPLVADWLTDAAHCQEQLAAYWDLIALTSHLKDIWPPFEQYLHAKLETAETE